MHYTRYLVQTPLPYLSGIAHVGTLSQAIRCDTLCRLANIFQDDVEFPYSFHLTGLPVSIRIKGVYQSLAQGLSPQDALRRAGLWHLIPHMQAVPRDMTQWYELFRRYYRTVFQKLGIDNAFVRYGECHTTTPVDPGYDRFLNQLYDTLSRQGVLGEGIRTAIYCEQCHTPLGDHERSAGQGLGTHTINLTPQRAWIAPLGLAQVYLMTDTGQSYRGPVHDCPSDWRGSATVISQAIRCRCGGQATLVRQQTIMIKIDEAWRSRALRLVQEITARPLRKALTEGILRLRDYAFLRAPVGYGSTLEVLQGGPYRHMIVDPLGDSMIHTWYPALRMTQSPLGGAGTNPVRPALYCSALDLIPNHLVLMVMMYALPALQLGPLPHLVITGYLVGEDCQKMSKSRGNVLTWEDLQRQGIRGIDFRHYVCTLADNTESQPVSPRLIQGAGRAGKKAVARLHRALNQRHISPDTLHLLTQLRPMIRPWESPGVKFGLRRIYHTLFHRVLESLSSVDHGLDQQKATLRSMLQIFNQQ